MIKGKKKKKNLRELRGALAQFAHAEAKNTDRADRYSYHKN